MTVTSLPAADTGTLALSATAVTANQVITKADIDADNLTYTPPANANGAGYATFMFTVNDGEADSASASAYTMTIDVTAVNDPPVVATEIPNQSATVGVDFSYAFPDTTFTDDDSPTPTYTATQGDDSALPTWLTFTAATRTFSGRPTAGGTLMVRVTATDADSESVSDTFNIRIAATDVCLRTPEVRDAIVTAVSGVDDCADLTDAHLAGIGGTLRLTTRSFTSLNAGDFGGLTGLTVLALNNNVLTTLPAGIFDGLTGLTALHLDVNSLTALPAGIFDSLTVLEELYS